MLTNTYYISTVQHVRMDGETHTHSAEMLRETVKVKKSVAYFWTYGSTLSDNSNTHV